MSTFLEENPNQTIERILAIKTDRTGKEYILIKYQGW